MSGSAILFMIFGMLFLWGGFATAIIHSSKKSKHFDN